MARERFIHISEEEWRGLIPAIARELWEFSTKGYGYKFVSNETGKHAESVEELCGALVLPLTKALEGKSEG